MFWFRRSPAVSEPTLDNESYRRWLRAQCPPLTWFLRLAVKEQEQLAIMGDEYAQDIAIAIGFAVADPKAAQAGIFADQGDAESEAILAEKIARNLIQRMTAQGFANQPKMPQQPTFAGIHSKNAKVDTEQVETPPTFLGSKP